MHSVRELLKKNNTIKSFGKWFRRAVLHSKYLYFIKSSPAPLSNLYGFDRGTPLDRYFIEAFLAEHKESIKGACLEVRDGAYTAKYGTHVSTSDILDIETANTQATIIDDLRTLTKVVDNTYDSIILTQVFQFVDDVDAAMQQTLRVLKPGGTVLVTLPALSRSDCTSGTDGDYWRFTQAGAKFLFEKVFPPENITITTYGNARTGQYFFAGLSVQDTPKKLLHVHDENFPTIIAIKAVKNA